MEQLNSALVSIKVLRARVGQVFETLGSGIRAEHGEEGRETKFLMELQELLNTVNNNLRYFIAAITMHQFGEWIDMKMKIDTKP